MNDVPPSNLGEFRVEGVLGRGSIGQVHRGSHSTYGFPVVLLVVDSVYTSSPGFRSRLVQYSQTITSLSHPNVARVFKSGEQDGLTYIVMEAITGGALKSAPVEGGWTAANWAVVGLIKQAADGLAAVHGKGLVHGNITLSNLQLTTPDIAHAQVKVSDIGILALVGESGRASASLGRAAGVPEGPAQDIFGVGALLLEAATGRAPSGGVVREFAAGMPDELKQVILRCMATDPAMRFASCQELSEALAVMVDRARATAYDATPRDSVPSPVSLKTMPTPPAPRKNRNPPQPPPPLQPGGPLVPCLHAFDEAGTPVDRQYLRASGLTVGREPAGNVIALPSGSVSAVHARIEWDTRRVMITDLGSANGTLLQGHRLLPQVPQEWGPEQWLEIGPYWLWLQRPPINPPPPEVTELVLDRDSKVMTLTPGKNASCRLTLVNQRNKVDHVRLSVEGIPEEWVELPRSGQQLNPSDTVELTIPIKVPRSPSGHAGTYKVTFLAKSSLPDTKPGSVDASWTVLPFEASSVSITPSRSGGRRQARYTVRLQNDGNDDFSYVLTGTDEDRQLDCLFAVDESVDRSSPQIDLAWTKDGARKDVRVKVGGERRWFGSSKTYPFTIQARPVKGGQTLTADGQFTQRAIFPIWTLVVAPLLLIALILALPTLFRPVVRTVSLEPRNPLPGQRVEVIWDAPRASGLQLQVNTLPVAEPNLARGRYVFSEGFEADAQIRVVATNLFGSGSGEVPIKLRAAPAPDPAVVELFEVIPQSVTPGQQVTIRWRTSGATRVELQPVGTVTAEGSQIQAPTADTLYTINAFNRANVATTRTVAVRVAEATIESSVGLSLSILSPTRKNKLGMVVARVERELVVFQWRAENAKEVRIDGLSPVMLQGRSGQKSALLMGVGQYEFTLVAINDRGREFRSEPVRLEATCSTSWFREALTAGLAGCKKPPEVQWK